ncbi:SAM-dependent methyltransferase [Mycolicibacterium cosmeticum]|uniref:SAM-dependent methyltransferase n=1 Tax=Mycolicibacterium cosmeticum TaxID=258533 RepID=UPI00055FD4CE|nr:SAM-dependent methyltransferase [Mycolicibacterium cosmeticum]TLH72673.1 SAM-dependent methyltransferase [Mycolicibacterium cosmeticum]
MSSSRPGASRESSVVVRPIPPGSGFYTAGSRLQAAGLKRAIALFEQTAQAVPIPSAPRPIVIADYGAANGHNSLLPISAAIAVLRKRTRPEHSILVTHTDVPDNDFSALFRVLDEDPDSYLKKDHATYASAVGRSFYTQIIPSNSVNLGWSAWAVLWLGRVPGPVPDHIHASFSADAAVRAAHDKQAAFDWHEFVAFRGRELCPGGRAVVITMAVSDDGEFGYRPVLQAVMAELTELVARGVITEAELVRMNLPIVGRRAGDFLAPFAPSGRLEQLSVEHLEVFDAEDRFWQRYRSDRDAAHFGSEWAAFVRAAVFPTLAAVLPTDRRTAFCDALEAGVAARLAAEPEQMRIPLALVVLHKRPKAF